MPATFQIQVSEPAVELKARLRKTDAYLRPRITMLLYISKGVTAVSVLCTKIGISAPTLRLWKTKYRDGGLEALVLEGRGGDKRSGITPAQKQLIVAKLSNPKDALRSYKEAQTWLKEELGIAKEYHALNKYLKRNFGTKLKVGRKSHIKKDEAAVAVFKKPGQ